MSWVFLDDNIVDHPKTLKVWSKDPAAFGLDVRGIAYAARQLTDGFVPEEIVAQWLPEAKTKQVLEANSHLIEILLQAGRWERVEGGFQIHGYLDYNKSRAKVIELRKKRAKAGSAGGKRSGTARREKGSKNA